MLPHKNWYRNTEHKNSEQKTFTIITLLLEKFIICVENDCLTIKIKNTNTNEITF